MSETKIQILSRDSLLIDYILLESALSEKLMSLAPERQ